MNPSLVPEPEPLEPLPPEPKRRGSPSRQPKRRLVIEVTPDQHIQLQQTAQKLGVSLGNMIRRSLLLPDIKQGQRCDINGRPS